MPRRPRGRIRRHLVRWLGGVAIAVGLAGAIAALTHVDLGAGLDRMAVLAGLGIEQVEVTGYRNTLLEDIYAALDVDRAGTTLRYDVAAARKRLEALPWIASAQVTRLLPDRLEVRVSERRPYAIWQHRQMLFLIDAEGRTLEPIAPSDYRGLKVLVGEGAAARAREILELVGRHPEIAKRLTHAVRVADRRWTLKLADSPDLVLPEDRPEAALALVATLEAEEHILERAIEAVDLRVPGRVALRLSAAALARMGRQPGGAASARGNGA